MITGLPEQPSMQSPHGSVLEYISPSRLNCWLACGLKFKLTYIDGLQSPTTPSLFLGKQVHSGLERLYRYRQLGIAPDIADLSRQIRQSWESAVNEEGIQFENVAEEQALQRQTIDLVAAYTRQMPADEPRPLAVEASVDAVLVDPFNGENLGIPLLGIMDLVLDGPEGPGIVDFKTTARSSDPLEVTHEVQLSSYAWLFRQVQGRREAGLEIRSLIKTKVPRIEVHRYESRTERHFRRLFALIRAYLDDVDAGRFVFRPGFHCGMCDFCATECRAWAG